MRLHRGYCLAALALFAIEVVIALFVRDAFIRPIFGDVLAAALVYCGWLAVFKTTRITAAAFAFAFACVIETLQYLDALTFLGLEQNPVARVVLGTTFSWGDILAYLVGALGAVTIDMWFSRS